MILYKTAEIRMTERCAKLQKSVSTEKTETVVTNLSPNGYISELCGK